MGVDPEHGQSIAGRVLCLPGTIGSSSAAAVLLELVHSGHAPRPSSCTNQTPFCFSASSSPVKWAMTCR
jgi:predicted aconitase with swiveling domain